MRRIEPEDAKSAKEERGKGEGGKGDRQFLGIPKYFSCSAVQFL